MKFLHSLTLLLISFTAIHAQAWKHPHNPDTCPFKLKTFMQPIEDQARMYGSSELRGPVGACLSVARSFGAVYYSKSIAKAVFQQSLWVLFPSGSRPTVGWKVINKSSRPTLDRSFQEEINMATDGIEIRLSPLPEGKDNYRMHIETGDGQLLAKLKKKLKLMGWTHLQLSVDHNLIQIYVDGKKMVCTKIPERIWAGTDTVAQAVFSRSPQEPVTVVWGNHTTSKMDSLASFVPLCFGIQENEDGSGNGHWCIRGIFGINKFVVRYRGQNGKYTTLNTYIVLNNGYCEGTIYIPFRVPKVLEGRYEVIAYTQTGRAIAHPMLRANR